MSFAFIQDCDFRSSSLQHCDLTSTTFEDCRADASTRIEGSIVVDTELRVRGKTYKVSTPQELTRQVRMFGGGGETKEISTNVAERCRTLVSLVLSQLVDPVQKQFFSKHIDAIRPGNLHGREQVAVDKVIRSAVVSALCDVDYTAGSRETVTVTKRWRSAVVDFVSTGHISNGLESVVSKIAVRAARYLA